MKIELTDDEIREIDQGWDYWNDESYPIHAAYILRAAIERAREEIV